LIVYFVELIIASNVASLSSYILFTRDLVDHSNTGVIGVWPVYWREVGTSWSYRIWCTFGQFDTESRQDKILDRASTFTDRDCSSAKSKSVFHHTTCACIFNSCSFLSLF